MLVSINQTLRTLLLKIHHGHLHFLVNAFFCFTVVIHFLPATLKTLKKRGFFPVCAKHRKGNTQCAKCNIKGLEKGGRTIFCLDCNEIIRKEMEDALSLS